MRKKPKVTFAMILHLSEMYCEQHREKNLCLSPEQNDAFFRDFGHAEILPQAVEEVVAGEVAQVEVGKKTFTCY